MGQYTGYGDEQGISLPFMGFIESKCLTFGESLKGNFWLKTIFFYTEEGYYIHRETAAVTRQDQIRIQSEYWDRQRVNYNFCKPIDNICNNQSIVSVDVHPVTC